jgi:hypothetical protein
MYGHIGPFVIFVSGGVLLSRAVAGQVPSALKGLTSVFGMRTGGAPSPLPPDILSTLFMHLDNGYEALSIYNRLSPRPISIGQLNALLHLHPRPINPLVSRWPYSSPEVGISLLEAGFTLRCLQRLSLPHFATRLCRWRDNRFTRGASIPVLSY